jgi:hypothetical protein
MEKLESGSRCIASEPESNQFADDLTQFFLKTWRRGKTDCQRGCHKLWDHDGVDYFLGAPD